VKDEENCIKRWFIICILHKYHKVVKIRSTRVTEHVARIEQMRNKPSASFWSVNLNGRDQTQMGV